ncbi:MAG TPA: hypothetical protein VE028_11010 [Nitratidesulfovibrio sp.]|nr:hypothetical protein [Nitratidesulfovibrio sp.]
MGQSPVLAWQLLYFSICVVVLIADTLVAGLLPCQDFSFDVISTMQRGWKMGGVVERLRLDTLMFQRVAVILIVVVDHVVWFGMGISDEVNIAYVICIEMMRIFAIVFALMETTHDSMNKILTAMMVYCFLIALVGGYSHGGYHYRIIPSEGGDFMHFRKSADVKLNIGVLFFSSCVYLFVIYFAHKLDKSSKE